MEFKMELVKKEITVNDVTFGPVVRYTVDLPVELVQNNKASFSEDDIKMALGTAFFNLMK